MTYKVCSLLSNLAIICDTAGQKKCNLKAIIYSLHPFTMLIYICIIDSMSD